MKTCEQQSSLIVVVMVLLSHFFETKESTRMSRFLAQRECAQLDVELQVHME